MPIIAPKPIKSIFGILFITIILVLISAGFSSAAKKIERQKLPILVGENDRKTIAQYAEHHRLSRREVEKRFASTGKLNCPWIIATANLIKKSNLIVTNAHILLDRKGKKKGQLAKCRFIVDVDGKERSVWLSNDYIAGHRNSQMRDLQTKDWLIIRLKESLPQLTPYQAFQTVNPLASKNAATSKKIWNVTVVAARHSDWPKKNGRVKRDTKSIGECRVRDVSWRQLRLSYKDVRAVRSDCDSGPGSSGGGYLIKRAGQYYLVGLITGLNLNAKVGRHKYKLGKHDAYAILLSGAFLKSLNKMASQMDVREVQRGLEKLGFDPGPIDGQMGRKTRAAITAFENQNRLSVSGKVTVELRDKILEALN